METIGVLVDQLCVVNIKIWMAEDIKRNATDDKSIANATRLTNIANQQRSDLIQSIDEKINHLIKTGELQRLYGTGSTKIYGKQK